MPARREGKPVHCHSIVFFDFDKAECPENDSPKLSRQETPNSVVLFSLLETVDAKPGPGSLHQNPIAPLLQDMFGRIFASRASRAPCARSLYEDPLYKMFVSGFCVRSLQGHLCKITV